MAKSMSRTTAKMQQRQGAMGSLGYAQRKGKVETPFANAAAHKGRSRSKRGYSGKRR